MSLKKVSKGADLTIPADDWNAMIDAAVAFKQNSGGRSGGRSTLWPNVTVVKVMNTTGSSLPEFAAVGIDDIVQAPTTTETDQATQEFLRNPVLTVRVPTSDDAGLFVVLRQPLQDQEIGLATAIGVCACSINLVAVDDTTVDVIDGDTTPESSTSGSAQIMWVAGGVGTADDTGIQFALIRIGGGGGGGTLPDGVDQYTYLGCLAQNSPPAYGYIRAHGT